MAHSKTNESALVIVQLLQVPDFGVVGYTLHGPVDLVAHYYSVVQPVNSSSALRARLRALMATITPTAPCTTSAVLALSKATWKIAIALSNLKQEAEDFTIKVKELSAEFKALGVECDQLYSRLEELVSETTQPLTTGVESGIWECLALQINETSRTVHDLELLVRIIRGEELKFIGQAQRLRKLTKSKEGIAETSTLVIKHTNGFRLALLLLNT